MRRPRDKRACTECGGRATITYGKKRWCASCFDAAQNVNDPEYLAMERHRAFFGQSPDYDPCKEAPGFVRAYRGRA